MANSQLCQTAINLTYLNMDLGLNLSLSHSLNDSIWADALWNGIRCCFTAELAFFTKNQNWCCNCQKIQGPRHETFLQKILGPNIFCALFIQIDYSLPTRENVCWWVELINLAGPVIQGRTTETKPTQIRADPPHQNRYRFLVLFI